MPVNPRHWEVLDRSRIVRGRRRGRRIEWRVSLRTKMQFYSLLAELVDLEQEPASPEREERRAVLQDEIRALPSFPRRYHPEDDLIVPVTTSEMR